MWHVGGFGWCLFFLFSEKLKSPLQFVKGTTYFQYKLFSYWRDFIVPLSYLPSS